MTLLRRISETMRSTYVGPYLLVEKGRDEGGWKRGIMRRGGGGRIGEYGVREGILSKKETMLRCWEQDPEPVVVIEVHQDASIGCVC